MATQVKVGVLSAPTAPGPQSIASVGFQPEVVIFMITRNVSIDTSQNDAAHGIGFAVGPTASTDQRSLAVREVNSVNPTQSGRRLDNVAILDSTATGTQNAKATLQTFDSDGFTLDWTMAPSSAQRVLWMALAGDLTNAAVVEWEMPTVAGAKVVSGLPFQPETLIHIHAGIDATALATAYDSRRIGMGVVDSSGNSWAQAVFSVDNASPSDSQRHYVKSGSCLVDIGADQSTVADASHTGYTSDGFTMNFATAPATAGKVFTLALRGLRSKAGVFSKSVEVAPAIDVIAGIGFTPRGLILSSVNTGTDVNASAILWANGFSDGATEANMLTNSQNNSTAAAQRAITSNTKAISLSGNTANVTVVATADVQSFNPDDFTLNWTINNAVAYRVGYLALGDAAVVAGGDTVKIKQGGAFVDKPILTKVGGVFVNKPNKVKVGGVWV